MKTEEQKPTPLWVLMDMKISVEPEYLKMISERINFQNQVLNKLYENTTERYLSNLIFHKNREKTDNKEVTK